MGNETTSFGGLSGLHSNGCDGGHETEVPHNSPVSFDFLMSYISIFHTRRMAPPPLRFKHVNQPKQSCSDAILVAESRSLHR